ncbi:MAG: hypothetical protein A2821_02070 [Candidatus Magasanikbacteria bacterium RIFCSPHIGHO2_01_FULL_41_23]|uniref:LysM domain-containing protein n=1 Tax=Candidatus Magasanikbacteria bacterium RIFCSPLOWO2_01_FULL_40_15 TaxID=1798686 RepID=A0A1F6N3V9_9BACT|nr:MAG: hypothetical protein A2821_02070 [Candidatus Magasanikbacteria bacterium RIFCSPHIGHO2_01_FULL_41_23]OGH76433.1 MAG: hypothetical protein A3F22_00575 [Candidatus Magasanikbacteria bacterium RIFCSPHIGHO2_12_FULL_41_16]OGH78390.1 MAG: hypothetical protein A2983_02530 [Candidatus Magasanikbacteria bacterium RIFCSPLOWO2_01_FULL_40_15]
MKVKSALLEVVWYLARLLVYIKRGFLCFLRFTSRRVSILDFWYKKTVGFTIFKISFYFQKRFFPQSRPGNLSAWYKFGERWVLQILALGVAFFFIIPQTKLYKPDFDEVPGKKTILYALVGPGEQDFALSDELIEEIGVNDTPLQSESWRQGSIIVEPQMSNDITEDEYSTTIGGAVVKPSLASTDSINAVQNTELTNQESNKVNFVEYHIKAGDVLGVVANKYGIKIETVLSANNLTTRSIVRPGDIIKIPSTDGILYSVAKGDTISRIAKLYGVSVDEILKFNDLNNKSLRIGKQILIPGAKKLSTPIVKVPPANNKQTPKIVQKQQPANVDILSPVNTAGYIWPSGARTITQYYGLRHTGVDIAGSAGLPNYAVRDGVVVKSQCGWNGGYGCYIILDHGSGVQTLYGHNSKLLVSVGEYVAQGQVIALLGSTGRSTGPHLHFEIRLNGRRTNPLKFIRR